MTAIAIDARAAAEVPAGRGRAVRELLLGLARRDDDLRYLLYARRRWDADLDGRFFWQTRDHPDGLWHLWAARHASRSADVLLSTNSYLTAWFASVPTAVSVYDLIAFLPWAAPQRRAAAIERLTIRPALRRAELLLCISEATRADLEAKFPVAGGKTAVTPLAAAAVFGSPGTPVAGVAPGSVLSVGTLEPRKNVVRALEAYSSLPAELRERHPLVVAGARGWEEQELLERAREANVQVLTDVSDEQLAWLYSNCSVFLFPSLYEGFGLPLLEAMTAGAACVTSRISSLPEVGGEAVRYIDPLSVDDIAGALSELLADAEERRRLGEAAKQRAAAFSWDRTAAQTLQLLRSIARR